MRITITEASKLANISRQQLYRGYINKGKISVIKQNNKAFIDVSELMRVFPDVTIDNDTKLQEETVKIDTVTTQESEVEKMLKTQLAEAKERELWLTQQIDELRKQQTLFLENKKRKKLFGIF